MDAAKIYEEDLPDGLKELRDLVGITATLKLVDHYGGIHVTVPSRYFEASPLVGIVGHRATSELVQRYGGNTLYIAKADKVLRALRNIEIATRFDAGIPAWQLAREYGLSERQIWSILTRPETLRAPRPEQPSLFD